MSRTKRTTTPPTGNTFADALRFCALILKDQGTINETHVSIQNNWVTAYNGILSIGHKCEVNITTCPQIKLATEALSKCGQSIAIAQLENNRLSIKSERFKAIIPCIAPELLQPPTPDLPIADIDNRLKEAFEVCGLLQTDNAQTIYGLSVLMNSQSLISSLSGQMLIEYWHGINLPQGLAIPKALIAPLSKINKKLAKIGFSSFSITFYFEDESWIKSQLYAEQWPDIGHVFDCTNNVQQFPADFWTALAAVSPFSEGLCFARNGRLYSHAQEGAGAEYEVPGLQGAWCYPSRQLAFLKDWATHCDFQAQGEHGPCLYAMGKNARAVVAGVRQEQARSYTQRDNRPPQTASYTMDDDIPF